MQNAVKLQNSLQWDVVDAKSSHRRQQTRLFPEKEILWWLIRTEFTSVSESLYIRTD